MSIFQTFQKFQSEWEMHYKQAII